MSTTAFATVKFPACLDTMFPIEISDPDTSLEAGFVQRYSIESLSDDWKRPDLRGIYILLSDLQWTNSFQAYIGSTFEGFEDVLYLRNEKVHYWTNALLFSDHDGTNLTEDDTQQVEELVNRLLHSGAHIKTESDLDELEPEEEPDYTVDHLDQLPLRVRQMALFIVRVLFLKGYRSASLAKAVHAIEPVERYV